MSHPLLLSHLPCTTSTSSSSFTLLSTTTPEHSLQSGPHDLLQEHLVLHQLLQEHRSKSNAIKNHSGVKTSRGAETCAKQSPQKMRHLRPRMESISPDFHRSGEEGQDSKILDVHWTWIRRFERRQAVSRFEVQPLGHSDHLQARMAFNEQDSLHTVRSLGDLVHMPEYRVA